MEHSEGLHEHYFWLYGVFVGLAIQQALGVATPHLLNRTATSSWHGYEDAIRLGVFLFLIIRFYLGSGYFFKTAYIGDSAHKYKKKNYFIDFVFGLFHFLLFFGLAATLEFHDGHESRFLVLLLIILMYDGLWFLAARRYDTRHLMKMWAVVNVFTVIVGLLTYLICNNWFKLSTALSEELAFIPLGIVTIIDFAELNSGHPIFANWLTRASFDPLNPPTSRHKSGSTNRVPGIYRSDCCEVEKPVPTGDKFPACDGQGPNCDEENAHWAIVQATR